MDASAAQLVVEDQDRAVSAERALLGSMLMPETARPKAAPRLAAGDFVASVHAELYAAAWKLRDRGLKPDPHVLMSVMRANSDLRDAGGPAYLAQLARAAPMNGDETDAAKQVQAMSAKRTLYSTACELAELALQADMTAPEAVAQVYSRLEQLRLGDAGESKTLRDLAHIQARELLTEATFWPTATQALDFVMEGGLYPGKLYAFAARPKVGKTLTLCTIAGGLAVAGIESLYVALEMGEGEIAQRIIARAIKRNALGFLRRGDAELADRVRAYAQNAPTCLRFEDRPSITFDALRRIIPAHVARHKTKVVLVDYWQLVGGRQGKESEVDHLGKVAQWMADYAKSENIAIVTAAQINREGMTRGGDGLKLACSMYLHMHPVECNDCTQIWMKMEDTRYTLRRDVGTEEQPVLYIDKIGPHIAQWGQ